METKSIWYLRYFNYTLYYLGARCVLLEKYAKVRVLLTVHMHDLRARRRAGNGKELRKKQICYL